MDRMSEERFEEWLRDNAGDYNEPPGDVPREAMWTAIAAARRPRSAIGRPASWRRTWMPRAAAAALLIATGTGLGYWLRGPARTASSPVVANQSAVPGADTGSAIYEVASAQHLTAAEALLTSFRSDGAAESDAALRGWARDLLASTRLLMDSPAATDPGRRKLLEDLEYVLAQIVQLSPNAPPADRALVEQSIGREQVLIRIRSSIPAGFPSGN
jgi:hypothetical protein